MWNGAKPLLRNIAGNVFPLAAMTLIVLSAMVGGGVDMSRAYMAENRLQNACDAGVLAGRKAVGNNGFDSTAQTQARLFFNTNFDATEQDVTNLAFTPTTDDGGNTVTGVASARMNTVVMQLFGYQSMPISVSCSASMSIGNSDVMMVLDVTGSMDWTVDGYTTSNTSLKKITILKNAMKSFYDTVSAAATAGNGRVRFGFVPYNSAVNVGRVITDIDPSYIANTWTYQSRQPQYVQVTHQQLSGYAAPYTTSSTSYSNSSYSSWTLYNGTSYKNTSQCSPNIPATSAWSNIGGSSSSTGSPYINANAQRVTDTTATQQQRRTVYDCLKSGRKYYVYYQYEYRYYYQVTSSIEDPIYTTYTTSQFDHFEYKPVTYDTSAFKTFATVSTNTGSNGAAQSSTWDGCIEERQSTNAASFSYSTLTGAITPSGAYDLDIDLVPSSNATRWGPLWDDISYYRTTSNGSTLTTTNPSLYGRKSSSYCPVAARNMAEMTKDQFYAYTDTLSPLGSTYHDIGMIWVRGSARRPGSMRRSSTIRRRTVARSRATSSS